MNDESNKSNANELYVHKVKDKNNDKINHNHNSHYCNSGGRFCHQNVHQKGRGVQKELQLR